MLRAAETTLQDRHRPPAARTTRTARYARAPVFVVADGMGGAQAGEVASRIAVEMFEQGLPDRTARPRSACDGGASRTPTGEIHERSRAERERAGMGTTLTAAYLDDAHVAIAHVGDSRAYLFRDGSWRA